MDKIKFKKTEPDDYFGRVVESHCGTYRIIGGHRSWFPHLKATDQKLSWKGIVLEYDKDNPVTGGMGINNAKDVCRRHAARQYVYDNRDCGCGDGSINGAFCEACEEAVHNARG